MIELRTITIDFTSQTVVSSYLLGKIGEHNATKLTITPPTSLSGDARTNNYRISFGTGGKAVLSESFTTVPFSIDLWKQLTECPRMSIQIIAYDSDGEYVGKSDKLTGFYFESSISGIEVEVDGENHDLAYEIANKVNKPSASTPANYVPKSDGQGGYSWSAESGGSSEAEDVSYANTESGLESTNVQDAIDEVVGKVNNKMPFFAIGQGLTFESNCLSANVTGTDLQRLGGEVSDAFGMMADMWTTNHSYAVGDYAIKKYQDQYQLFKCITAHTSTSSFAPSNWESVQITDEMGNASGGAFIVEFTENDDTYTANKTVKQIYDAFTEGKVVIGKYDKYVYYLTHCELSGSYYSLKFTYINEDGGMIEAGRLRAWEVSASSTTFEYTESIASGYAEGIMISDEGGYYSEESVEGALQEIGSTLNGLDTALANLL